MGKREITIARGDGIGPEIMDAVLHILHEAGAGIECTEITVGEKLFEAGNTAGIGAESWDVLERNKVFLKAPITTPQGEGVKSLNVTIRKAFGLFANVRPTYSYAPYVRTKHPGMDLVIVRENEEGLYAGVEYQLSDQVLNAYKLVSTDGTERIIRFAFEYAVRNKRKKVSCFSKDNILKITDGYFHKCFRRIAEEYPQIESEHWIVDIGCARLADVPEQFDVVVMPNLYGDMLSDMTAQISGSVGLAGSANIGTEYAMFEAIHGSAPRRAGQNMANPSGLLLGGVLMMAYINQSDVASRIHNAWLRTIESGVHTYDIYRDGVSTKKVGTKEFAQAVAANLGQNPEQLKRVEYASWDNMKVDAQGEGGGPARVDTIGADFFIRDAGAAKIKNGVEGLAERINTSNTTPLVLEVIGNRGTKIWPDGAGNAYTTDVWQCRFRGGKGVKIDDAMLVKLYSDLQGGDGLEIQSMCKLIHINDKRGYSLIQGE